MRWTGQIQARFDGNVTLITTSDDGVKVWINGQLLVNDWVAHGNKENWCTFASVAGQKHDLRIEYYQGGGGSFMRLEWQSANEPRTVVPATCLYPVGADTPLVLPTYVPGTGTGLTGDYRHTADSIGSRLRRLDPIINFPWGGGSPDPSIAADNFTVRWSGQIQTRFDGDCTLSTISDDGVRLFIDGKLLINDWNLHGDKENFCTFPSLAGQKHDIRIEYFESGGGAAMYLKWQSTNEGYTLVPTSCLYPYNLSTVIPTESAVSPAFFEGVYGVTIPTINTGVLSDLGESQFYANVPLSATKTTPVTLTEGSTASSGSIVWTPTVVTEGPALVIRKGDSLLFAFPASGSATITNYSGTFLPPVTVTSGQVLPVLFSKAGEFKVLACDGNGIEVGSRNVTVVSVDLPQSLIGEVQFTRALNLTVSPSNAPVTFMGNNQLTVTTTVIADGLAKLALKPLARGTPRLLARINGMNGPLVCEKEVKEFTLESASLKRVVVFGVTGIAAPSFIMRPYIPDVYFEFKMFAHRATFAGGAKNILWNTSDLYPNGTPVMESTFDPLTNEMIGRSIVELELPVGETMYCFDWTGSQINSPRVQITTEKRVNGCACTVKAGGGTFIIPETNNEPEPWTAGATQNVEEFASGIREFPLIDSSCAAPYQLSLSEIAGCVMDSKRRNTDINVIPGSSKSCEAMLNLPGNCDQEWLRFWDNCKPRWPDVCRICSDSSTMVFIDTGLFTQSTGLILEDCENYTFSTEHDFFEVLHVDIDGYTGTSDYSTRNPISPVCVNLRNYGTVPRVVMGIPVQITRSGLTKENIKVRLLSRSPDKVRVSSSAQITVPPNIKNATDAQALVPDSCVELTLAAGGCSKSGVIYLYGLDASVTLGDAFIELQANEERTKHYSKEIVEVPEEEEWVIADTEPIMCVEIIPQKVTFTATDAKLFHTILQDSGAGAYGKPNWWDKDDSHDAATVGEHRFPIAYTRGATIKIEAADFKITPPLPSSVSPKVRGGGSKGYNFGETTGTTNGAILQIANVDCVKALDNSVDFVNSYEINWEIQITPSTDWCIAGVTDNRLYVTLGDPLDKPNLFETVIHTACNRSVGATDDDAAVNGLWGNFSGRTCSRKPIDGYNNPDGQPLTYWGPAMAPQPDCWTTAGLLKLGDGRCGAWADFMHRVIDTHGISIDTQGNITVKDVDVEAQPIGLQPTVYPPSIPNGTSVNIDPVFFVKKWDLSNLNTYNPIELNGDGGQNNPDPRPWFENHAILQYKTKLYDPSYGTGPFASEIEWEDASLDGYGYHMYYDQATYGVGPKFWPTAIFNSAVDPKGTTQCTYTYTP